MSSMQNCIDLMGAIQQMFSYQTITQYHRGILFQPMTLDIQMESYFKTQEEQRELQQMARPPQSSELNITKSETENTEAKS